MSAFADAAGAADVLRRIDTSVAHPARRYNYWLGGKDHFAADRESGDRIRKRYPAVAVAARENRAFLRRAVQLLTERGVVQFLDIGTGIPVADDAAELQQRVEAGARFVYVDNDPIVLAHARALLTTTDPAAVAYLDQDLRKPAGILADPALAATLNLDQPVGLLLGAVLHFIDPADDPAGIVAQLAAALPSGSYVVLSHGTADYLDPAARAALPALTATDWAPFHPRSAEEISDWLTGLDVIEPGLVSVVDWHRPDTDGEPVFNAEDVGVHAVVARKP